MNHQERELAFAQGLAALERAFGVKLVAVLRAEALGDSLLTRPGLFMQPIEGWQPPETSNRSE